MRKAWAFIKSIFKTAKVANDQARALGRLEAVTISPAVKTAHPGYTRNQNIPQKGRKYTKRQWKKYKRKRAQAKKAQRRNRSPKAQRAIRERRSA